MNTLDTIQSRVTTLTVTLLLMMAGMANANVIAYEPFDYPVENNLDNGTPTTADGFTGNWTCGVSGWILSGLNYTGLPVANNSMRSPAGRQSVSLEEPLSSGEKWISFLFKSSPGNSGANINGVYFPNGSTGLFFGFGLNPYSATQGYLSLASMNTTGTAVQSATKEQDLALGTYGAPYLVVLKIEFNTSGNNDTITAYLNPTMNAAGEPDASVVGTPLSTFDVGNISGFGTQVSGAGEIIVDEIRIAGDYNTVVDAVVDTPSVPAGLNAAAGENQVSLSWAGSTSGYPTSYNVKRSEASDGPYVTIGSTTPPTVSYTDSILGGTPYYYVVSAVNIIGESADSSFVSATPILAAPAAPNGLSALEGDSQISLSWSSSTFATSYEVKRASKLAGPYVFIGTTADPIFSDSQVLNSQTYYYVVAAIGDGGSSPDTSPISATPFGPLPLEPTIEPGVGITWFASNNATYQVQWASEDLGPDTVWNDLGNPITGDDSTMTVFDPSAPADIVYRVISF